MPQNSPFDPNQGGQASKITAPSATGGRPKQAGTSISAPPTKLPKLPGKTGPTSGGYRRLQFQQAPDDNLLLVNPPSVTLQQVVEQNGDMVGKMKEMLWKKYQQLPAAERQQGFWKNVYANAEGAAAGLVRKLYTNMNPFAGEAMPKLDEAMKARLAHDNIYQLLSYIDYPDRNK